LLKVSLILSVQPRKTQKARILKICNSSSRSRCSRISRLHIGLVRQFTQPATADTDQSEQAGAE
jgi:hypothetical protein